MKIEALSNFQFSQQSILQKASSSDLVDSSVENAISTVQASAISGQANTSSSTNMLAGNFVQLDYEQSRYIQGKMAGIQAENTFRNSMDSIVNTYAAQAAQAAAEGNYAELHLVGMRAENAVEDFVEGEISKKEQERMEKNREQDAEEAKKTEEEAASGSAEGAGESAVAEQTSTAPAEEAGTSASETSQAPAEAAEQPAAEAPESAEGAASTAKKSIDITV